ncbi:MAG: TonB-dependent receptor plug domain-containing protein, partial [Gemmatimonadetes bacterium]|nr:TonB-dependent receptor plug domain-containing protein [Gemmatimonadota bacterium]
MRIVVRQLLAVTAVLLLTPLGAVAQEPATVAGQVTSEAGQPLVGASVVVEGTSFGALTNADGRFRLTVPASRVTGGPVTITASQLGYRSVSRTVTLTGGTTTVDFALGEDPLRLDEIVVTGQGTKQERRKLGVVINTVEGEAVAEAHETNTVAALAGKAPNVEVTSNAGDPGASAYIRIRGAASIVGGTQPLFVVDGTPIDNSSHRTEGSHAGTVTSNGVIDLNPDDIESVDILKGAAASAIYGSRGANGVV